MTTQAPPPAFDWNTAPLPEANRRLADLKRIYDKAVKVVASRQAPVAPQWRCWSQSHKAQVPESVLAQCHDKIPDGRWVFRDDGARDRDGQRCSIVCCSILCHKIYQQWAIDEKFKRKAEEECLEREAIR